MNDPRWFAGRSVLVTGPAGIVGSRLVRALLDLDADVVGIVRDEDRRSELYRSGDIARIVRVDGDLADIGMLERVLTKYEISAVFHLGAQTQVRHAERLPLETLETNVRGTYLLLEAARRYGRLAALIVASSDKAYGDSPTLPYLESHPLAGRNMYDVSKSVADLLASSYSTSFGLPVAIARCANVYGPGDLNWDRIVPGTIRSLLTGRRPVVRSDGSPRRDYIYVDDAVDAYIRLGPAAMTERGEAFNFGAGRGISVLDLVAAIGEAVGRQDLEPEIRNEVSHEIVDQWLDSTKARELLGWRPATPLSVGLQSSVEWYKEILS